MKVKMDPQVAIIMGSISDYEVMKETISYLDEKKIPYEKMIVSAHRTPTFMTSYASKAKERGIKVIIAAAGGAAHLPGMTASYTTLPVIGVPIKTTSLNGIDSLYSIVQMPKGVPVATVSINGAENAAILATQILGLYTEEDKKLLRDKVKDMNEILDAI